jgi:hypothetical protein
MLEREYLKTAAAAGQPITNGGLIPSAAQLKMLQKHMEELDDDIVDDKLLAGAVAAEDDEDDDLILAGAAGAAPTDSAYNKIVMGD